LGLKAEAVCGRSLEIHRSQLGQDDPRIAETLDAFAFIQLRLEHHAGHHAEAEESHERDNPASFLVDWRELQRAKRPRPEAEEPAAAGAGRDGKCSRALGS